MSQLLKPLFKQRTITKDDHKFVVKKVVDKVGATAVHSQEILSPLYQDIVSCEYSRQMHG